MVTIFPWPSWDILAFLGHPGKKWTPQKNAASFPTPKKTWFLCENGKSTLIGWAFQSATPELWDILHTNSKSFQIIQKEHYESWFPCVFLKQLRNFRQWSGFLLVTSVIWSAWKQTGTGLEGALESSPNVSLTLDKYQKFPYCLEPLLVMCLLLCLLVCLLVCPNMKSSHTESFGSMFVSDFVWRFQKFMRSFKNFWFALHVLQQGIPLYSIAPCSQMCFFIFFNTMLYSAATKIRCRIYMEFLNIINRFLIRILTIFVASCYSLQCQDFVCCKCVVLLWNVFWLQYLYIYPEKAHNIFNESMSC